MRRKGLWLSALATVMVAGGASATSIEGNLVNGLNWGNYGPSNFNANEWRHDLVALTPNSGYRSVAGVWDGDVGNPGGDPDGAGPRTSSTLDVNFPAAGGQNYDAEELFYFYEDLGPLNGGYLHLALITGFNPDGEASNVGTYPTFRAGDLFVDLGNDGTNDIAVAMSRNEVRSGSAWANTGFVWPEYSVYYDANPASQPDHTIADPFRINEGTPFPAGHMYYDAANVTPFDGLDLSTDLEIEWTQLDTNGNPDKERWMYEIRLFLDPSVFDDSLILDDATGGIGAHWTMECGNDYIFVSDNTPFAPVPVPAAAPMALLGMALVSLVRRKRQAKC